MRSKEHNGKGLRGALEVLLRSSSFRSISSESKIVILASSIVLLVMTCVGVFAIDVQAKLLLTFRNESNSESGFPFFIFSAFVGLNFFFEFLQWLRRHLQSRISARMTIAVRRQLYKKFNAMNYSDRQLISPGELAQLFTVESSQLAGVWTEGVLSFALTLILTLGVSLFLTYDVGVSGSVFFIVLVILIFLAKRFAAQSAPFLQRRAEASSRRLAVLQEAVRSVFLVKALTAEDEFERRVGVHTQREQEMKLQMTSVSCRYIPIFASLRWLGWAGLLIWIVYAPHWGSPALPEATLVALVFSVNWYSGLLQDSFLFVGTYLSSIQVGAVAAKRLDAFLERPLSRVPIIESTDHLAALELQGVSVEYPSRPGQKALKNVSLKIPEGKLTVLVGPVGSGKSTLLRTLLGELVPVQGQILLRKGARLAYLPQDVTLPSATLRDVLRYEFDNSSHEDALLLQLLAVAEFEKDLSSLSSGLATPVGERGVTLSGGQRLRIGLAQVSYFRDAEIVLLDDPLAALDSATAESITSRLLCGYWAGKTRVMATHRPELVARADVVFRLEDGQLVDFST